MIAVQVLCWGVANLKRHQSLLHVEHPYVEVECGGVVQRSGPLKDMLKMPVFENPLITLDVVSNKL